MRHGNGNPAVLTGCYGLMNRRAINGNMCNKIPFVPGSSQLQRIGHIKSDLMIGRFWRNRTGCRHENSASDALALLQRQIATIVSQQRN